MAEKAGPRKKPGPKPPVLPVEGRDYYCGTCIGHRTIPCPECFLGCADCLGIGEVKCPQCLGGAIPTPPPVRDLAGALPEPAPVWEIEHRVAIS